MSREQRRKTRVISPQQRAILGLYIDEEHPEHLTRALYGSAIMYLLKLESGVVYPALRTLERRGVLLSEPEAPPSKRILYRLSDHAEGLAALAEYVAHEQQVHAKTNKRKHIRGRRGAPVPATRPAWAEPGS